MLDPVSSLSLASSLITAVDFASKIIKGSNDIRRSKHGATITNEELELVARDFAGLLNGVTSGMPSSPNFQSPEEEELRRLADAGKSLLDELLQSLQSLKPNRHRKGLSSVRAAMKIVWNDKRLRDYAQRLQTFQNSLVTHLTFTFIAKQSAFQGDVDALCHEINNIQLRGANEVEAMGRTLQAQAKSLNSNLATMLSHVKDQTSDFFDKCNQLKRYKAILRSLLFTEFSYRETTIEPAHAKTFAWALSNVETGAEASGSSKFYRWLQHGEDLFWIEGKAGSGKSTLMKYMVSEPQTLNVLKAWSGTKRLIVARHFFWYAGTSLQKSQQGLCQNILSQILSECPHVIPLVCPERYNTCLERDFSPPAMQTTWSMNELRQALNKLKEQSLDEIRICIFIDGLDEYSGDHWDIIGVIFSLLECPSIKICASSRPWNVFFDAFATKEKMTLEDLTRRDISLYVRDKFETRRRSLQLRDEHENYDGLIQEIVHRSSGVFLWVFLVVRSLLRGLDNYDTLTELQSRLDEMPNDLFKYFQRMLDSIDKSYQAQSARLFQLLLVEAADYSVITLSFFDQTSLDFALNMPNTPWTGERLQEWEKRATKRIRARCTDLIEVKKVQEKERRLYVHFLHRTIHDFLVDRDVQQLLQSRLAPSPRPAEYFAAAFLAQIKIWHGKFDSPSVYKHALDGVLASCFQIEHVLNTPCQIIIDELNKTLVNRIDGNDVSRVKDEWDRPHPADSQNNSLTLEIASNSHLDRYIQNKVTSNVEALASSDRSILLTLIVSKMQRLWQAARRNDPIEVSENNAIQTWKRLQDDDWVNEILLRDAEGLSMDIGQMKQGDEASQLTSEQLLVKLFERGADPNDALPSILSDDNSLRLARLGSLSTWTYFFRNMLLAAKHLPKAYCIGLLQIFLEHGADQHIQIEDVPILLEQGPDEQGIGRYTQFERLFWEQGADEDVPFEHVYADVRSRHSALGLLAAVESAWGEDAMEELEAWLKTYNQAKC